MNEKRLLTAIRAAIAAKQIPKKKLARRCKISRSYFSMILQGEYPLPLEVKDTLIAELGLQSIVANYEKIN
jgi:transcriptional regulator with XRE-family HTH domain